MREDEEENRAFPDLPSFSLQEFPEIPIPEAIFDNPYIDRSELKIVHDIEQFNLGNHELHLSFWI
jgi:hypothetical protein